MVSRRFSWASRSAPRAAACAATRAASHAAPHAPYRAAACAGVASYAAGRAAACAASRAAYPAGRRAASHAGSRAVAISDLVAHPCACHCATRTARHDRGSRTPAVRRARRAHRTPNIRKSRSSPRAPRHQMTPSTPSTSATSWRLMRWSLRGIRPSRSRMWSRTRLVSSTHASASCACRRVIVTAPRGMVVVIRSPGSGGSAGGRRCARGRGGASR